MAAAASISLVATVLLAAPTFIGVPFGRLNIAPIGSVSSFSLSPSTLSFPSSTPINTVTTTSTANWTINLGVGLVSSWTLTVAGTAPSCTNAPLSSVTVLCTAITDSGIGLTTHSCALASSLSTTAQTVASGSDSLLISGGHRSVSIQYSFLDTWKYTATSNPCNVSLSYVLTSM